MEDKPAELDLNDDDCPPDHGLCDKDGNDYRDLAGNRILQEQQIKAEEFSLQELASGMIGPWAQATFQNFTLFCSKRSALASRIG